MEGPDIRIGEVVTDIVMTDGVGPLSPEDVKRIVALVLDQIRLEQDRLSQRQQDTAIHDRAYRADR